MTNTDPTKIERLIALYAAFNARDVDAVLPHFSPDVAWPRAFKGGFVRGPEAVRAYWSEQWTEIDPRVEPVSFHPQNDGQILVGVHQIVRDLAGEILADVTVGHLFHFENDLVAQMEVVSAPANP